MSTICVKCSIKIWQTFRLTLLMLMGGLLTSCLPFIPVTGTQSTETALPGPLPDLGSIMIVVRDANNQPMFDGVVVQVSNSMQTDDNDHGEFRLTTCNSPELLIVRAPGYKTSFIPCNGSTSYDITLVRVDPSDNPNYSWVPAGFETDPDPNCAGCHAGQRNASYNEFSEWRRSGHAKVFSDRYLETMYLGTNVNGNKSPDTQWEIIDNRLVRHAPMQDASYFGPGYKLDFPFQYGKCGYCHVPSSVGTAMTDVNLAPLFPNPGGSVGEGVTCDICHKALGIVLDKGGFPYVDRPGILSFQFIRPWDGSRFYTGPLTNIVAANAASHQATCSSIFSQSEFCAACHYGKFEDTVIYNSYGEWKVSKYGDNPNEGDYLTCQDCHMPPRVINGDPPSLSWDLACAANSAGYQDFNHNLMNFGVDERSVSRREIPLMVVDAAKLEADFNYEPDKKNSLKVVVRVENTAAGHKFPTDSPLRHLILLLEAKDQFGNSLAQVEGERIPNWGGMGNPYLESQGVKSYGGLAGKIFANLLVEADTNISPTAAYWNKTKLAYENEKPKGNSDTRLVPGEKDRSEYFFSVPANGEIKVTITLIYRFAFFELMSQKGWLRPDIIVTSIACTGAPTSAESIRCKDVELSLP